MGLQAGFRDAIATIGVPEDHFFIERGDFTPSSGRETVSRIPAMRERPTAVFCSNDDIALVTIHEFRKAGLLVPQDVSVVGVDDVEVSRLFNPGADDYPPAALRNGPAGNADHHRPAGRPLRPG